MANKNPQLSTELIAEFNILYNQLIPNKSKGIKELSNEKKEELSPIISNLATRIYEKAILLKSDPDFNKLKENLYKLYSLYRAIFIEDFRKYGQNLKNVQGVANNKKIIALNLKNKNNKLKKTSEPMGISYSR